MTGPVIPDTWVIYYTIFAMLVVGLGVEKYYVNRVTLFGNSAALVLHTTQLSEPGLLLWAFTIAGLIVGIAGIVTYIWSFPLPDWFYEFAYFTYSSAPIAVVMLLTLVFPISVIGLVVGLLIGALLNSLLLTKIHEDIAPVDTFDHPIRLADALFGTNWHP